MKKNKQNPDSSDNSYIKYIIIIIIILNLHKFYWIIMLLEYCLDSVDIYTL